VPRIDVMPCATAGPAVLKLKMPWRDGTGYAAASDHVLWGWRLRFPAPGGT